MNEYKIIYVIESLTTEHTRYFTADSEDQARAMFLDQIDKSLIGNNQINIISVTRSPESDEMCYCTDKCC